MNYGKFRFEQNKKAQQAKKKQKQQQVKEVKLRPSTEENDYQTKLTNLRRFITDGDKAKEAAEKISQIREQASEEFENTMLSSHMGTVFASN